MKKGKEKYMFTKKGERITIKERREKLSRKKAKQAKIMFTPEKKKQKKKSKKLSAEKIGEKIGKGVAAIKGADIVIQEWAESPEVIPPKTIKKIKKGKGVIGKTYRGYKRAQKAEKEYAGRLEKGTKAHEKRVAQMNKLVGML